MDDWSEARTQMVAAQLERRGIRDRRVLAAMRQVPRHLFVPPQVVHQAYHDRALPIGEGQTISQPFIVARMTEILTENQPLGQVLEIGTGSGYQAAVLSLVASQVISIERRPDLAASARARLARLGFQNIEVIEGDGTLGFPERAPFDGIMVTAGAPHVPEALKKQLAEDGRMIIPVGDSAYQVLTIITRRDSQMVQRHGDGCVFVPLVGKDGWPTG
jgi:protein-L-isoaspartate(D-aspartate) O-methyltransferase